MKKRRLNLLYFFLFVIFVFTFNVTSSRYIGQIESRMNDVNAIPILNLINPTFDENISNILPGSVIESDFYVSNYDSENINEVLMKYYIKVKTDSEIPIKIYIFDENGIELTLDEEGKTPEQELIYGTENITKYHIKLQWDEKDNSYELSNKNLNLNIELIATQVVEGE